MSDLIPDDILLMISGYHHSLSYKLIFRSINKNFNRLIPFMKIRQIKLKEISNKIFIKLNIIDSRNIYIPFGLFIIWFIACQKLTNGNQPTSYDKTINFIKKWLDIKYKKRNKQLFCISSNAALRWAIGQRK